MSPSAGEWFYSQAKTTHICLVFAHLHSSRLSRVERRLEQNWAVDALLRARALIFDQQMPQFESEDDDHCLERERERERESWSVRDRMAFTDVENHTGQTCHHWNESKRHVMRVLRCLRCDDDDGDGDEDDQNAGDHNVEDAEPRKLANESDSHDLLSGEQSYDEQPLDAVSSGDEQSNGEEEDPAQVDDRLVGARVVVYRQ